MPNLPFNKMCAVCTDDEAKIIRAAQNRRNGSLRASKPFSKIDFDGNEEDALYKASANYVWRMLCFDYCGFRPHNCMPITADWDIGAVFYVKQNRDEYADYKERLAAETSVRDVLDALIKKVEAVLPVTAQAGVMQWGQALGMI